MSVWKTGDEGTKISCSSQLLVKLHRNENNDNHKSGHMHTLYHGLWSNPVQKQCEHKDFTSAQLNFKLQLFVVVHLPKASTFCFFFFLLFLIQGDIAQENPNDEKREKKNIRVL